MITMKDSGVEWIGNIPQRWDCRRLYYFVEVLSGYPFDSMRFSNDKGTPLIRIRDITSGVAETYYNGDYDDRYLVTDNNLLVGMDGDFNVRWWLGGKALLNQRCCKVTVKDSLSLRYVYYALPYHLKRVNELAYSTTVKHLAVSDITCAFLPFPTSEEQSTIVAYLDQQCDHIDSIIEKTQKTIEEYKMLKKAVITEAVTRGVRGQREMKKSKIEWLTEIPSDWKECRIKNVIFPQEKTVNDNDEIITCFRDGEVTLRKNRREDGYTISFTEHGYHGVDIGDLVIHGMDAFAGAIGCSDSRGKISPVVHVCHTAGNNRYFMYYLRAMAYGNILMDLSNGVRIRSSDYRNFAKLGVYRICVPSLSEQNEIVDYLDKKTVEIESLIIKKESICAEMELYKKSLVYEYVTGKKEVTR